MINHLKERCALLAEDIITFWQYWLLTAALCILPVLWVWSAALTLREAANWNPDRPCTPSATIQKGDEG